MNPYITYNDNSSEGILSDDLFICNFEYSDTVVGFEKEYIKTDITTKKYRNNFLGAKASTPISFHFSLVKSDATEFTLEEIRTVTKWLVNPNVPKKLYLFSDGYEGTYYYNGCFEKVEQKRINGTMALICHFVNDSAYLYEDKTVTLNNQTGSFSVNCVTDDINDIYPIIELESNVTDNNFKITNVTDGNKDFKIKLQNGNKVKIDCENAIIKDEADVDISFHNIGWTNLSDIYWLKLKNGTNNLVATIVGGSVNVVIKYTAKIYGGVLNEFTV